MPKMRFRPLTALLLLVAVLCVIAGIVYFTTAAKDLPSFVPGHAAHSPHHHVKHGLAMITLAVAALAGAWFTTLPARSANED